MKIKKLIMGVFISAACLICATSCREEDLSGNIGQVTISAGDTVAEFEIEGYGTIKAKLFPDIAPIGVENFKRLAESGYYDGKNIHRVVEGFMMQGGSANGDGTGGNAVYTGEGSTATDFGTEINRNARHIYGALCYANAAGRNTTQFYIVNNKEPQDISNLDISQAEKNIEIAKSYKQNYSEGSMEYNYYEYLEKEYTAVVDWFKTPTNDEIEKYKQGGAFYLDGGYTVFGQVVEGFDIIDSIADVEVTMNAGGELSQPVEEIIIKTVKVYTAE